MSDTDKSLNCSFCGKNATEVKKLIEGPEVYICDKCVDLCLEVLHGPPPREDSTLKGEIPTPKAIKEHLDKYVIGQDHAKMVISVAVYNHYKRLENPIIDDVEIEKSNILLLGPTGSGKTLIAQSIARLLDVPLAIADATSLTEAGYVGEDVESIISRLLQSANYDVKKAERGIVFIDELDKKRGKGSEAGAGSRDVSGEGVQQALLKLLEGSEIMVAPQGKKSPTTEMIKVNTKNILFVVGGAFVGLEKIVERDQEKDSGGIGIGARNLGKAPALQAELLRKVQPEHLVKYGLIPELIGRLPVYACTEELTEDQLIQVLTIPKNAVVKQFAAMFGLDKVSLQFTDEALLEVAKIAKERKTGARGLRSVIENHLVKLQFDLPDLASQGVEVVIITDRVIKGEADPHFVYAQA